MKLIKTLIASLAAMVIAGGFALSAQATLINGTIGFTSAANATGGSLVNNGGGSFSPLLVTHALEVGKRANRIISMRDGSIVSNQG